MGKIVQKETNIETVGELIKSLERFAPELPIEMGLDSYATVYFDEDEERVCIEGEDDWGEDPEG